MILYRIKDDEHQEQTSDTERNEEIEHPEGDLHLATELLSVAETNDGSGPRQSDSILSASALLSEADDMLSQMANMNVGHSESKDKSAGKKRTTKAANEDESLPQQPKKKTRRKN